MRITSDKDLSRTYLFLLGRAGYIEYVISTYHIRSYCTKLGSLSYILYN